MYKYIFMMIILIVSAAAFAQSVSIQDSYNAESRGDYSGALETMLSLVESEPSEPFYRIRQAWLLYLLGRYNDAITAYQRSLQLMDNLDAQVGIINCHLALGNWDLAISLANVQMQVHRQNPTLIGKAAYASYMKKDYGAAADYYGRIVDIYPWDMDNRAYYVNNLYLSGRLEAARAEYAKLKKYYPQSQVIADYKAILE